jgi:hypothetical protein
MRLASGDIDFDDINARMAPDNRAQASALLQQLEVWDNEKQLQAISTEMTGGLV